MYIFFIKLKRNLAHFFTIYLTHYLKFGRIKVKSVHINLIFAVYVENMCCTIKIEGEIYETNWLCKQNRYTW